MSRSVGNLCGALCVLLAARAACATGSGAAPAVRPSDCLPRDADSTCAAAVAGTSKLPPVTGIPDALPYLYSGPLAGVPTSGYAYWGFDFIADESGNPSPVRADEFINRSSVPVTITLSFDIPTAYPCGRGCMPRVQFLIDWSLRKITPDFATKNNKAFITQTFAPGQGYGWVIGLWQASHPRLTVTVPPGSNATLQEVGISGTPDVANEIPATIGACDCWDSTTASCSEGTRFSNGLLGIWSLNFNNYFRAGAFNNCPLER